MVYDCAAEAQTAMKRATMRDGRPEAAIDRGSEIRKSIALKEGGCGSPVEVAALLRCSRAEVVAAYKAGHLLGWRADKQVKLPLWQFDGPKVLAGLIEVLGVLNRRYHRNHGDADWARVLFFLAERRSLRGRRPLDLLRGGDIARAMEYAKSEAEL